MDKMTTPVLCFIGLLLSSVTRMEFLSGPLNTVNVLINVTAGTVSDTQLRDARNLQIQLSLSVGEGQQVLVNDFPVQLSGVTRFQCQARLLDSTNGSSSNGSGDTVSTVTRVMVSRNRLYSDSDEVVALQVFSEVIEMDGKEVQQPDVCEVKILMSPDFQKLAQFVNVYPIGHSEIFRVPRANDVVATDTARPGREDDEPLLSQTTSRSLLKNTQDTREETAAPGRLPETPLRMDPDLLRDVGYDDGFDGSDASWPDPIQMETPPSEVEVMSSCSAMCEWLKQVREHLWRFCSECLPLFVLVMLVVVIGVVGSAVVVKLLGILFPASEQSEIGTLKQKGKNSPVY